MGNASDDSLEVRGATSRPALCGFNRSNHNKLCMASVRLAQFARPVTTPVMSKTGRRMYALILAAAEKRIKLGFNDADDPGCRIAEVWIE
jgi:hypothetical protein